MARFLVVSEMPFDEEQQMSKSLIKVTKEKNTWHSRWEKVNAINVVTSNEKTQKETLYAAALGKVATLEKLCRALQTRVSANAALETTE
eukprot:m.120950 g.120950  ORF g.120950 m.120950 type:complete len:89 (-) comp28844_c0_seq1:1239-1505(-)